MDQEQLYAIGRFLRTDPLSSQRWAKANISPSQQNPKSAQIDAFLANKLSGSWFLHRWYRWWYALSENDVQSYVNQTLTHLKAGTLELREMPKGQIAILNTIQKGALHTFSNYLTPLLSIVYEAIAALRMQSKPTPSLNPFKQFYKAIQHMYTPPTIIENYTSPLLETLATEILHDTQARVKQINRTFLDANINTKPIAIRGKQYTLEYLYGGHQRKAFGMISEMIRQIKNTNQTTLNDVLICWGNLQKDTHDVLVSLSNQGDAQAFFIFEKMTLETESAWEGVYALYLQTKELEKEKSTHIASAFQKVSRYAQLQPSHNWYDGGDQSIYANWQICYEKLRTQLDEFETMLQNDAIQLEYLNSIAQQLQAIHQRIQDHCETYFSNLLAIVPVVPQDWPLIPISHTIPLERRIYSHRAIGAYITLDTPLGATEAVIKKAYRRQLLVTHPDRGDEIEKPLRQAKFRRVQDAYVYLHENNGIYDYIEKGTIDFAFIARNNQTLIDEESENQEMARLVYERNERLMPRLQKIGGQLDNLEIGYTEIGARLTKLEQHVTNIYNETGAIERMTSVQHSAMSTPLFQAKVSQSKNELIGCEQYPTQTMAHSRLH